MTNVDSLGRAIPKPTPLTDNVRRQIAEIRAMDQKPRKLRIDLSNWDALVDEIVPLMPMYPAPATPLRIFGLEIQFTPEPDFEVVE